jgi:uncharacterized protein
MLEQKAKFYSDGYKLDGAFFADEHNNDPALPIVIVCSGFTGLKNIHPERFARALTPRGFTTFGFDYRGFGASEGPRAKVFLEEQVRDIANAVSFVGARANEEDRKLVLAGWGMGGGLVLDAYKIHPQPDALIAMNGFFNAKRVQKALRGERGWQQFVDFCRKERARLVQGGAAAGIDPFDIYPLDAVSREYVDNVLRKNPDYGLTSDLSFADSLLSFEPESNLQGFEQTPLLIAHGAANALHPVEEAKSLYARYPGPKELFLLDDAGHTEWMLDDNPLFVKFSTKIGDWIKTACGPDHSGATSRRSHA